MDHTGGTSAPRAGSLATFFMPGRRDGGVPGIVLLWWSFVGGCDSLRGEGWTNETPRDWEL